MAPVKPGTKTRSALQTARRNPRLLPTIVVFIPDAHLWLLERYRSLQSHTAARLTHAETIMPDNQLRQVLQRASTCTIPTTAGLAKDAPWLGGVRVEETRRSREQEDAPADNWQPGDGYQPRAENLQAAMDATLANNTEAGDQVGALAGVKMVSAASCGYRHGKARSRGSVIAANVGPVANYTPPALRESLHESS